MLDMNAFKKIFEAPSEPEHEALPATTSNTRYVKQEEADKVLAVIKDRQIITRQELVNSLPMSYSKIDNALTQFEDAGAIETVVERVGRYNYKIITYIKGL